MRGTPRIVPRPELCGARGGCRRLAGRLATATLHLAAAARPLLAVVGTLHLLAAAAAAQAPYRRWQTLETEHFRVHAEEGLEREGRVAGAAAERAYARLQRELAAPRLPIDIVVGDDYDVSNGSATPFPTNRIVVFAAPPVESSDLRLSPDWLESVITHELTHIFHLDRARGLWRTAQKVFGRNPYFFPAAYQPVWFTEGLAVYEESHLTTGGRLRGAAHVSLVRAAAAENQLLRLDQVSLGASRFPVGAPYVYGSLFLDHLARTLGDSAVRQLVEAQAGALPLLIDRSARSVLGRSVRELYMQWRDSVQRSVGPRVPPLAGWRELTTHGFYASSPRWLDDSTLVYTGLDGRSTDAAYLLTLDGTRRRLGRRNGLGGNVPLAGGGLLYSQLEFTGREELRADLYVRRGARETRLTHGARLVQPDARRGDGAIVAVELAPARSSIVLLDSLGRGRHAVALAGPDEEWSDPRWSPDGEEIAAVRRAHGGEFSVEVLHLATGSWRPLVRSASVLSAPSWSPDGRTIVYAHEVDRQPRIEYIPAAGTGTPTPLSPAGAAASLAPELSPSGARLAASALRADGYHVGVAPANGLPSGARVPRTDSARSGSPRTDSADSARPRPDSVDSSRLRPAETPPPPPAPVDTQQLATGHYRRYSPWRTLVPSYWAPVIEGAPGGGTRLGAFTSAEDVIGRHAYSLLAAVPTSGRFPVGALAYRFSGLRGPVLDASLSQDHTSEGALVNGGTRDTVGTLLRRTRDVAVLATWVRPRARTYSTFSAGVGMEARAFLTDPAPLLAQLDTVLRRSYRYPRATVAALWSNVQRPLLSISPEDGVVLALTARERLRTDAARRTASASVVGTVAGYRSLDLPGFAHHVLAARVAGGLADRRTPSPFEIGGTSGAEVGVLAGYSLGEGRRTFGVRGFPAASIHGTRALAASVEYRAPVRNVGRGLGSLPFFLDRASVSAFADAATATCAAAPLYRTSCAPAPRIGRTLASVGAELGARLALFSWDVPLLYRLGVAVPVAGRPLTRARPASIYLAFGQAF